MRKISLLLILAIVAPTLASDKAYALSKFKKAFQVYYIDNKEKPFVDKDKVNAYKAVVRKASCNLCHQSGEKKTVRNEYGKRLAALIREDANKRIREASGDQKKAVDAEVIRELQKAFKEVEKMKSPTGETYAERIKSGQLPVELKKR